MRIGLGLAALGRPGYLNLGHGADLGTDRSVDALRRNAHTVLDAAAAAAGTTPDALALAAVLAQPWADVVLSGAAGIETLHSNLRALEVRWSPELAQQLDPLQEDSPAYWSHRPDLAWN